MRNALKQTVLLWTLLLLLTTWLGFFAVSAVVKYAVVVILVAVLSPRRHPLLHSPCFWLVTLTRLLAGVWWGRHHWLTVLVDELLPQSLR